VWFRKGEDPTLLAAGFGISRATAYRYLAEGIAVLAAQAVDLHDALKRVADEGWSHVILDGKLFATDRLGETTTSVKGKTIDAWYPGKHHDFGANIQAIMRPDGLPVWTSDALPGHLHDFTRAHEHDVLAALYWAASQLDPPTLADSAYEGAGQGVFTPSKQPNDGHQPDLDNRTYNSLQRSLRCLGERGFRHPHRAMESHPPHHREPPQYRRHCPSSTSSHTLRIPISTKLLLRSGHSKLPVDRRETRRELLRSPPPTRRGPSTDARAGLNRPIIPGNPTSYEVTGTTSTCRHPVTLRPRPQQTAHLMAAPQAP
jgi:hypothetical protein